MYEHTELNTYAKKPVSINYKSNNSYLQQYVKNAKLRKSEKSKKKKTKKIGEIKLKNIDLAIKIE